MISNKSKELCKKKKKFILPLMVFVGQQFGEGVAEMAFLLFIMSEASVGKT